MGIDFKRKGSNDESHLFHLPYNLYLGWLPVFNEFERRTGILLTPMGCCLIKVKPIPSNTDSLAYSIS
jgi:hypothetical protein